MKYIIRILLVVFAISLHACQQTEPQQKPNVLFIVFDDLRPELGCYNKPVYSPNIDKLASEGILFERSYCNIPVCGASRSSILTGQYPARTKFTTFHTRVD